jgi:hypothetical protein
MTHMGEEQRSIWRDVRDGVLHAWGRPVGLNRLLDTDRSVQAVLAESDSVDFESVVRWDDWPPQLTMFGERFSDAALWAWDPAEKQYRPSRRLKVAGLTRSTEIKDWTCDIREVTGLSGSKSSLELFQTLDAFAEEKCIGLIADGAPGRLAENLEWYGLRYLREPSRTSLVRCLWSPRLFLMNPDGSHHFAAARYLAGRLKRAATLRGTLRIRELDERAVVDLRHAYDLLLVEHNTTFTSAFHDCMKALRAAYAILPPPRRHEKLAVLALPRHDLRSRKAALALREAGAFDLGAHLGKLCAQQAVIRKATAPAYQAGLDRGAVVELGGAP